MPLHRQVYLVIRDGILAGRYEPGSALPSEEHLARCFGVSRVTLRVAMGALEGDGLVQRLQGRGTFVQSGEQRSTMPMLAQMSDVVTHMREVTKRTYARVIEFGYEAGPAHLRERFELNPREGLQRVVRVRHSRTDDRAVMHLTSHIRETIGRHFEAGDLDGGSLLDVLARRSGVDLRFGEQAISATLADPIVAGRLGLEVGSALIQVRRWHLDKSRRAIWHLELLASPADFELRMSLEADELRI